MSGTAFRWQKTERTQPNVKPALLHCSKGDFDQMGGSICVKATVHFSVYLLLCIFPFINYNNNNKQMHPFTESQWQELELQALIFHHVAAGIPVPSRLILPLKRSFSLDPFSLHLSMNYGRKAEEDPEPWRCKRTDGKKWRCSREAAGESKYCERHKHRGKRCSNKTSKIPFFTNPNYNSCSGIAASSSYSPLPLTLYSHPNNSNLSSFLGDSTHPFHFPFDTDGRCFNGQNENSDEKRRFLSEGLSCNEKESSLWSKEKEKVEHCFVFGADLKLQKPMDNVDSKSQEAQNLNLKLNFVDDSWMNSMEEQEATQLSISSCRH